MTTGAATSPLDYASRVQATPNVVLYRISLTLAVLPQAVGLGTLALYAYGRWEFLPLVGLMTLCIGSVVFLVSLICLHAFRRGLRYCDPVIAASWNGRSKSVGWLLALNLGAAAVCIAVGIHLMGEFLVTVVNATAVPVTSIRIDSPGDAEVVPFLGPGDAHRVSLDVRGEGPVTFSATQNGATVSGTVNGYVSDGAGGRATLVFTNAGPAAK